MPDHKRVVITGASAVSPFGHTLEALCSYLSTSEYSQQGVESKYLNDHMQYHAIKHLDFEQRMSGRKKNKLDLFCIYGLCAADTALTESRLLEDEIDKGRIGIFVGNELGGWGFTEPQLMELHRHGVSEMSAYVATAWFPAALQGQISLSYDITGQSKTFSSGSVSGLHTIGYAAQAIQAGHADAILCGAAEDLSSNYVQAILSRHNYNSKADVEIFGPGMPTNVADGAAFLVVEDYEHALARGADIYCELTHFSNNFCPNRHLVDVVFDSQNKPSIRSPNNLFILDGMLANETAMTKASLERLSTNATLVNTKPQLGNMFSVSGVMELACVAHGTRHGNISRCFSSEMAEDSDRVYSNISIRRISPKGNVSTLSTTKLENE